MPDLYPGAIWRPSSISHPNRPQTLGLVIHWTVGHEAGDIQALDGPDVDVQFYVTKAGKVYQFLDPDSQAWHAFHTANTYCLGIETEGSGEPWTQAQLEAVAKLAAYICRRYKIPVRHAQPRDGALSSFIGIMGHRDLSEGRVDGNDHTDSVPDGTGWPKFLAMVQYQMHPKPDPRKRFIQVLIKSKAYGSKTILGYANKLFPKKRA